MEIVIDIPDQKYKWIIENPQTYTDELHDVIRNGTPLPKGHGNLVDISPYKGKVICSHLYSGVKKLIEVDSIDLIIEADRKEQRNDR